MEKDRQNVNRTVEEFNKLCVLTKGISESAHCPEFTHHLLEMKREITMAMDSLGNSPRLKRGLFGQFMTSVFGVNDEVYRDINSLGENQHRLIHTVNQQSKLMISSVATIEETEKRINLKLESFRKKFNEGLKVVNQMNAWFHSTDHHDLNIHSLTILQLAQNYLQELQLKYKKLMDVQVHKSTISEFLSTSEIRREIQKAAAKLPSQLTIIEQPTANLRMSRSQNEMNIQVFFHIIYSQNFDVVQTTAVPRKITNDTFIEIYISHPYLAMEYNVQKYFELSSEQFEQAIRISQNEYILNPSIIRDMENDPNCIIDEIYNRTDKSTCRKTNIQVSDIKWKELRKENTWLFVANNPRRIAVICDGKREDTTLNGTGVIHSTSGCTIQNKKSTLHAHTRDETSIITTFNKEVPPNILSFKNEKDNPDIALEPSWKASDMLDQLLIDRNDLNSQSETPWKSVTLHTSITSFATTLAVILIAITIYVGMKKFTARYEKTSREESPTREIPQPAPRSQRPAESASRFELEPIYSRVQTQSTTLV